MPLDGGSTDSQLPNSLDALTSMRLIAALAREDQQQLEATQRLNRDLDVLSVFERLQPGSRRELSDSLKRGSNETQQLQQSFEPKLGLGSDRRNLHITATLLSQPRNLNLPSSTLTSPQIKSFWYII